jgi:hypothetical protein
MSAAVYEVDIELYINPSHVEAITLGQDMIVIKCTSGTLYTIPNDDSHINQLKRARILPWEACCERGIHT